jgi:GT2 family glycosyltransferase
MVYVLIPAHNNKSEVLEILKCLEIQSYKNIKIVLVDDGSTDNTGQEVKRFFPNVVVLRGNGRLWWTGANVKGVDYILEGATEGDFILLLNNDLLVKEDYVERLVNASISNGRGIVGSTLVDFNNSDFMESGIRLDYRLNLVVNRNKTIIEETELDMTTDVLPGRGTLIPREVFKKIGNFNLKKLPHYGADYEFMVRAKRAGFKLMVSHRAKVFAKLNITGLNVPNKRFLTLKESLALLFSKRSKTNIRYYLNYIWLCSERNYRVMNVIYNFANILANTLFKTVYFFFFYLTLSSILRFLFKAYPFRICDIERYGINLKELKEAGIVEEGRFIGKRLYFLTPEVDIWIKTLDFDGKNRILRLKRLSHSYIHKLSIVKEELNLLIYRGR